MVVCLPLPLGPLGGGTGTGLLDWLEPDEDEDEVRGG